MSFEPVLTARWGMEESHTVETYLKTGGYEGLRKALSMEQDDVIEEVASSNLRGRGGAGFPTGQKWKFVDKSLAKPTYVVANLDESEPGTFNNRELIERDPHQFIEGLLIASYAIKSHHAFVYSRGEFLWPAMRLERALAEAREKGFIGKGVAGSDYEIEVTLHRGAGAYICGEETALLESLEGKRGQPRLRPPFPVTNGLYDAPTAVNNVETLSNVPHIINRGADWYRTLGTETAPGTKMFSLSGKVEKPGNYEAEMGVTARELIEKYGGGILDGKRLKAWTPGGSSTPMLTDEHYDTPMDFDGVMAAGSLLGTGAMIILDERDCVVEATWRMLQFYAHESCGKCTTCREGNWWTTRILKRLETGYGRQEDIDLLNNIAGNQLFKGFCALVDGATSPSLSSIKHFRDEYEAHVTQGGCPLKMKAGVAS